MSVYGWLQAGAFFALVLALTKPLGLYMTRVFSGERTFLSPLLAPVERVFYRMCRIDPEREMTATSYLLAIFAFSAVGLVYLYVLLRTQKWLPLNPQGFDNLAPDAAWNAAVSFLTNTNWQFYSGESTMSYLSQMAGLAWHNFVSAAAGIAVAIAVIRGVTRTDKKSRRQFLGRPDPLPALRPVADLASSAGCCSSGRACRRTFKPYTDVVSIEGFEASDHAAARWPRKRSSKNSVRTAAASSTRTRPRQTRTRRRSSNLFELLLHLLDLGGAHVHVRPLRERHAPRLGVVRHDERSCSSRASSRHTVSRRRAIRSCSNSASRAATWKAKNAASASPPRRCSRR